MHKVDEANHSTRIFVHPPTPPSLLTEHAFSRLDSPNIPLTVNQADDAGAGRPGRKENQPDLTVSIPGRSGRKDSTQPDLTVSIPIVKVNVNANVDETSTVSAIQPSESSDVPESVLPTHQVKSTASSISSRSVHSAQTSSPRFSVRSGPLSASSRPSSQASLATRSATSSIKEKDVCSQVSRSSASILRRKLADHDSIRGKLSPVIVNDNVSLKSLSANDLGEFEEPPADSDAEVSLDSAKCGLTNEIPLEDSNLKRELPSVIVVEKAIMFAEVLETPFPSSPKRTPVVDEKKSLEGSVEALTMPTGSCLFSRTFDQELHELEVGVSLPPVRLATTPTASMFAETSSSVRAFVGYHYPGEFLPRMFWNYNLGKLIALTRFDSVTGESGTVLYSEPRNGKFGRTGRKEWEYRGRIVSTVWEATPKLRGRGRDALQTIYIKTLSKNDPRQLYNPLFLHTLRTRHLKFPELIGEWETMNLHVVVVRNCGHSLQKRKLWDRILQKRTFDVDWTSFIR